VKPLVLLLLLAEAHSGSPTYWWSCAERPTNAFADRAAAHLADAGFKVLDRCDELSAPVHKSYHSAQLASWQLINLGNAVEADQVVSGLVKTTRLPDIPNLGLTGFRAELTLTVTDVAAGKTLSETTLTAEGYDNDPGLARKAATDILWVQLPELRPTRKAAPSATLSVESVPTRRLREVLAALRKTDGVSSARLASLTRDGATFELSPAAGREAAMQTITALGLSAGAP